VPALAEDWSAWRDAFDALDDALASHPPTRLTLCGERGAVTYEARPRSLWRRVGAQLPRRRTTRHAWAQGL
jgi:hypothetical protein